MQKVEAADDPQAKFSGNNAARSLASGDSGVNGFSGSDFQRALFDTPQSVNSPQYDIFNSSFVSQLGGQCQMCGKEAENIVGLSCSHRMCSSCMSSLDGKKCRLCASPIQFQHNIFLSPTVTPDRPALTTLPESPLTASMQQQLLYQNMNGIASGLQESFSIWENNRSKLNSTAYESLSPGEEHHSVFSPLQDSRFTLPSVVAPSRRASVQCAACGLGIRATSYCIVCHDLLCHDCVIAHSRVRVTRDHTVVTIEQLIGSVSPMKENSSASGCATSDEGSRPSSVCSLHEARVICTCSSCSGSALCAMCLPYHINHKFSAMGDISALVPVMLQDMKTFIKTFEEAAEGVRRMSERVETSAMAVTNELRAAVHAHVSALEERKRDLLQKVDTIRADKQSILKEQNERLTNRKNQLQQVIKDLEAAGDNQQQAEQAFEQIFTLFAQRLVIEPQETDLIKFQTPDAQLVAKCRSLGEVESGACARNSSFTTENFRRAIRDRQCSIFIQLRDACGESPAKGYLSDVMATMVAPDGSPLKLFVEEQEGGLMMINYYPVVDGLHQLDVSIRGVSIKDCPTTIDVRRGRNYSEIATRGELFSFGKEGSGDGELCRPWGICIDLLGRVLVADRSNNRIQIFDRDGNFMSKFGSSGTRAGQFDRPAGIATNTQNHIVVADKDNHRIQVFDENGNFILKFGERGRPLGMFNYPWGVATNTRNDIAVSDTRNHRVQIFSSSGQFIRKCGFDTAYFYKHLDSPRGVCYLPDGQLLLTDFNNHRLAILSSRNSEMKVYGVEGDVEGMFCRPQGIKLDPEGHILVCDSRNNRIQVFSSDDMRCVATFGSAPTGFQMPTELTTPFQVEGSAPPSAMPFIGGSSDGTSPSRTQGRPLLDRPTDLAVSADGRVYVVDFGHNCIRVF